MSEIVLPGWRERVDELVGRRKELWMLAAIAAVAVVLALAAWGRGRPAIAPPATMSPAEITPTGSATVAVVLVHIAGAVRAPGLYEFTAGARVADAVRAAGGPRRSADLDALNLAELLVDGSKLEVPVRGAPSSALSVPTTPALVPGAIPGAAIDLNSADQAALETVPGLGPVKAGAILAHRDQIGGFTSIEQLLDVTGIGPATLESIRPYLTL